MDKNIFEKFLKLMASDNDSDAVMGLRGIQNLCWSEGFTLGKALFYAFSHIEQLKSAPEKTIDQQPAAAAQGSAVANITGMPECRVPRAGVLEVVPAGQTSGDIYVLPGESAKHADIIAAHLKDAIVAAVINKSRFKLKLNDIKNNKGEVVETALQAEYERAGMVPIRIWVNNKGEVGALATVLRKMVANSIPELAA